MLKNALHHLHLWRKTLHESCLAGASCRRTKCYPSDGKHLCEGESAALDGTAGESASLNGTAGQGATLDRATGKSTTLNGATGKSAALDGTAGKGAALDGASGKDKLDAGEGHFVGLWVAKSVTWVSC